MYAAGDGILRRDRDGTWNEVLSPAEYSGFGCGSLFARVRGLSQNDIWVNSLQLCILHFDGQSWTGMPVPNEMGSSGGIWPLSRKQILVSGQGGEDLPAGKIALWGSVDAGQSWTQFSDPVFTAATRADHDQVVGLACEALRIACAQHGGR